MKTFEEINEKIQKGNAVVATAEEILDIAGEMGMRETAEYVDVVTTATFGPMCSTGAFLNFGHSEPPIRMEKISLNNVDICAGLAAVDGYIGATEVSTDLGIEYGGAHVICDLIDGKKVRLRAFGKGTDCYPRKEIDTYITLDKINEAYMFNPRNCYQNYAAATNTSEKALYTYMGVLQPHMGNINYSTTGEFSPLLNDPYLRTIGLGTKIFIGGTVGYISWQGTQFVTEKPRGDNGVPLSGAATLALIGDLKGMSTEFIQPAVFEGYGTSIYVGVGIPIPVLDEEMLEHLLVRNKGIYQYITDYSKKGKPVIAKCSFEELQSGEVNIEGKDIKTAPLSSLYKARIIARVLKSWIEKGEFTLQEPIKQFPRVSALKGLN